MASEDVTMGDLRAQGAEGAEGTEVVIAAHWAVKGLKEVWTASRTAEQQFTVEVERNPALTEELLHMQSLLQKKLFHQLTDAIITHIDAHIPSYTPLPIPSSELTLTIPPFVDTALFIVLPHIRKFNNQRAVGILWKICEYITSYDALRLLDMFKDCIKDELGALHLYRILTAKCFVEANEIGQAEDLLEEIGTKLDDSLNVPIEVRSAYHRTFSSLSKVTSSFYAFYTHSQLYLSYTSYDAIPLDVRESLAFDISIAALLAEDVHSFGELLQQPILTALKGTEKEWIVDFLYAFREGELTKFRLLWEERQSEIAKIQELKDNRQNLEKKLTLLSFLELCFKCPKEKLSFARIAQHCNVKNCEVEIVIMDSMEKNLVKGTIDEVDRSVSVTWVKPRILDNARLRIMSERLDAWAASTQLVLDHLEASSPDLCIASSLA